MPSRLAARHHRNREHPRLTRIRGLNSSAPCYNYQYQHSHRAGHPLPGCYIIEIGPIRSGNHTLGWDKPSWQEILEGTLEGTQGDEPARSPMCWMFPRFHSTRVPVSAHNREEQYREEQHCPPLGARASVKATGSTLSRSGHDSKGSVVARARRSRAKSREEVPAAPPQRRFGWRGLIWPAGIVALVAMLVLGRHVAGQWCRYRAANDLDVWAIGDAQTWLARAARIDPENPTTELMRAQCYRQLRDMKRRDLALQRAKKYGLSAQAARNEITLGEIQKGELGSEASDELDKLIAAGNSPHDIAASYISGCIAEEYRAGNRVAQRLDTGIAGPAPHDLYAWCALYAGTRQRRSHRRLQGNVGQGTSSRTGTACSGSIV